MSIEDTAEVQVPHKNWTREITRGGGKGTNASEVGMFDLLKAALRQRPNYIIVGEIRGVEGAIAFQAIQTGHPVLSTFHAASVEKLIQRLTGDPINIPKTYVDNLNLVIIQSAVRRPDGTTVRRVLSINEIVGYNPQTKGFSYVEAFSWDPVTDTFTFKGNGSSYLLEQKIARKSGHPEPQDQDHLRRDREAGEDPEEDQRVQDDRLLRFLQHGREDREARASQDGGVSMAETAETGVRGQGKQEGQVCQGSNRLRLRQIIGTDVAADHHLLPELCRRAAGSTSTSSTRSPT